MPDENKIRKARIAVLDRMVEAGWLSQVARRNDEVASVPTDKGLVIIKELFSLWTKPVPMTADELGAFHHWIQRFGSKAEHP